MQTQNQKTSSSRVHAPPFDHDHLVMASSSTGMGVQHLGVTSSELTLIGVLMKNGRRKLQAADEDLVQGSLGVGRKTRKKKRMEALLALLQELKELLQVHERMKQAIADESTSRRSS